MRTTCREFFAYDHGLPIAFTLGLTLLVSAASVHYRDMPQILGHLLTFWFFLSPIVYKSTQVPEQLRAVLS